MNLCKNPRCKACWQKEMKNRVLYLWLFSCNTLWQWPVLEAPFRQAFLSLWSPEAGISLVNMIHTNGNISLVEYGYVQVHPSSGAQGRCFHLSHPRYTTAWAELTNFTKLGLTKWQRHVFGIIMAAPSRTATPCSSTAEDGRSWYSILESSWGQLTQIDQ